MNELVIMPRTGTLCKPLLSAKLILCCNINAKSPWINNLTLNANNLNDKSPLNAYILITMNADLYLNDNLLSMNAKLYTFYTSYIDVLNANPSVFNERSKCIDINAKCLDLNVIPVVKTRIAYISSNLREKATYRDLNHRINYCKLSLSGDIEVNPGPSFVTLGKPIHAPDSQGDVDVFGEHAGRQCVAMSLCSLIYVHSNRSILDTSALVKIMNLGNELYSMLSRISKQSYLLLMELPTTVAVRVTLLIFISVLQVVTFYLSCL